MGIIKTLGSGLVIIFIIYTIMAVLVGGQIGDSDLMNSTLNQSKANRIDVETAYIDKINNLDFQKEEAKTGLDIARIRRIDEQEQKKHEQNIVFRKNLLDLILILGGTTGFAIVGVISIMVLMKFWIVLNSSGSGGRKEPSGYEVPVDYSPRQPPKQWNGHICTESPWNDSQYRIKMRKEARHQERMKRIWL
jgi:hypothetical protein